MTPPSPPISPLTYNASEEEPANGSGDHQSIAEELYIISTLESTPKAGAANRWKDAATPRIGNGHKAKNKSSSSSDRKKTAESKRAKMSVSSTNGILAGQRNDTTRPIVDRNPFPSDGSVSTMASLTSVWRRLYLKRKFGNDEDNDKGNDDKKDATPQTSREEDEASLRELEENDAFALEVGLML